MRILAIDTALGLCSAAVMDVTAARIIARESLPMERGHAEALMPLVERVMAQVEGGFSSLDRVVTTVGPGSFTGLRVGLSAARAIGLAADIPVVGVTTLSAFAGPYLDHESTHAFASVIDARHAHVYMQIVRGDGRFLSTPRIIPLADAASAIAFAKARIIGSAASLLVEAVKARGFEPEPVTDEIGPDIEWVARLGAFANPEDARPIPLYLRPPDATPQTNGRVALR